jgi:hypothetical protein
MLGRILEGNARFSVSVGLAVLGLLALASGCSGGGGDETPPPAPTPPAAPTVTATPGNGQATLAWTAVSGATSYNVYASPTSPVTTAGTKTNVTATGTTLSGLANGTPIFVAVTAVSAEGESALSSEACAVPTAASTVGLTLYDPLCGSNLDAAKWRTPLFSRGVANGAMVLSTRASNMEANSSRGVVYSTSATVNATGQRVTTIEADITVPAATASRSGGAEMRAILRLAYQPPVTRFNFPAGSLDQLTIQVGLRDTGNGLRAFRSANHCDNASCTSSSSTGIAFADSPGFSGEAPASYDTTYSVTVTLNETTGVFVFTITGPNLNASGTVDPTAYLASNANWAALGPNPLAGPGFLSGLVRTRLLDDAGGSSGTISARFDDVQVGFNNAAPALWDDFSGAGGNSGPTQLSADKWTPGNTSIALTGGSLSEQVQITSVTTDGVTYFQGLPLDDVTVNTLQADVNISSCSNNSVNGTDSVSLEGRFYNDGTVGTTPPNDNQQHSAVGDIQAYLILDCVAQVARFQVLRWESTSPLTSTILSNFVNSTVPVGSAPIIGNTHTLRMAWDPVNHLLTFQVDDATPVQVDPTTPSIYMTTPAPYVKPPNSPLKSIGSYNRVFASPSAVGKIASINFRVNNVFTAP